MVDILFHYTDPDLNIFCQSIERVGQMNASWVETSGDDLLNHRFSLHKDFYLYGENNSYVVSSTNLVGVEVRQKK